MGLSAFTSSDLSSSTAGWVVVNSGNCRTCALAGAWPGYTNQGG